MLGDEAGPFARARGRTETASQLASATAGTAKLIVRTAHQGQNEWVRHKGTSLGNEAVLLGESGNRRAL